MFQMPMLLPDLVPFESHVGEKCDEHREKTQPNPLKKIVQNHSKGPTMHVCQPNTR